MVSRCVLPLCVIMGLVLVAVPSAAPLPDTNSGIAMRYSFDAGIASDPAVVFADDFESYSGTADLTSKWSEAYHTANIRIATEAGNVFGGGKSLEFTVPQTSSEVSHTVAKVVSPERDVLFLRYYARFDAGFNVVGSGHNDSIISAHYCCPGVRADGYNKFLVSYEALAWRHGDGESWQAQRLRLPSRAARHLERPPLSHWNGPAVFECALQFRTRIRFTSGYHARARPSVQLRDDGEDQHSWPA
jgi:hypothetical protein